MLYFLLMIVTVMALITMKFFSITGSFIGLKAMASILFILTGVTSYRTTKKNKKYFIWIFLGLIFSLGGDVFMEFHNIKGTMFIPGVGSFALAHIMYILGFCSLKKFTLKDLIIGVVIAIPMILLQLFGGFEYGSLQPVVLGYTILISLMVSKAISLKSYYRGSEKAVVLTIVGTVMFLVSDLIVLFLLFSKFDYFQLSYVSLVIYYMGQGLLALSLGQKLIVDKDSKIFRTA